MLTHTWQKSPLSTKKGASEYRQVAHPGGSESDKCPTTCARRGVEEDVGHGAHIDMCRFLRFSTGCHSQICPYEHACLVDGKLHGKLDAQTSRHRCRHRRRVSHGASQFRAIFSSVGSRSSGNARYSKSFQLHSSLVWLLANPMAQDIGRQDMTPTVSQ